MDGEAWVSSARTLGARCASSELDEGRDVVDVSVCLANANVDLLMNAGLPESDVDDAELCAVLLDQPSRQRGDATPARYELHHDVRVLDGLLARGCHAGGQQELRVDVESLRRHRVGDQDFVTELCGLDVRRAREHV